MITVYPALDLRDGRCVRLLQGDPDRQEVFGADPLAVARGFVADGARALHLVDLDGAFEGRPRHLHLLSAIAGAVPVPVQFGGGLRTEAAVAQAFEAGAARAIVGTLALEESFLRPLLQRWGPRRIVAGLDARGAWVAVRGWRETTTVSLAEAAAQVRAWGAEEAVYTQVQRDGMLGGPDLAGIGVVAAAGLGVVASGGVASAEHIHELAALPGVCGVVLGRALYTGRLSLPDALAAAGRSPVA